MTIRTAKGTFSASTFAALADWQERHQGAFPAIEIGPYTVDVDGDPETGRAYARSTWQVLEDDILPALRQESAGDLEMVALCERAMSGDMAALEACCETICDAVAMAA